MGECFFPTYARAPLSSAGRLEEGSWLLRMTPGRSIYSLGILAILTCLRTARLFRTTLVG